MLRCAPQECELEKLAGFEARLRERFPAMGPLRVVSGPPTLAHALEAVAIALQTEASCPVTFSRTTATVEPGVYQVVVQYSEETVGRQAMADAEALIRSVLEGGPPFDVQAAIAALRALDEDIRPGPSTGSVIAAAVARGIPYRRLTSGSLVQFGWGVKQRRIWAAEVDATSAVSEAIAQDKICARPCSPQQACRFRLVARFIRWKRAGKWRSRLTYR